MLKNLFYAVLFIALVVGLSFLMSTYLTIQQVANVPSHANELTLIKAQVAELPLIAEQVSTMSLQLASLAQKSTPEATPLPVVPEPRSYLISKALLQALNCKYVALNHSGARLIAELTLLEETIKALNIEQDTLLREISLARTETAAHIPSAQDRLEIIWKLLLMADKQP
ncbi:MAG: hypothetical protein FD169_1294 [Bacillota bacterium]|nr:MAG: hypothetical protein FD169_1294 [Bacillota bacterium]MBS3950611.1 hypothetical protein [Peptococcaceae bacterium]